MRVSTLLSWTISGWLVVGAAAESSQSTEQGASKTTETANAVHGLLRQWSGADSRCWVGEVVESRATAEWGELEMLFDAPESRPRPFEGTLEVWQTPQKETVIASIATVPGVVVYVDGDQRLTERVEGEHPLGIDDFASDLAVLLDVPAVAASIEVGASVVAEALEDGGRRLQVALRPTMLPISDGPAVFAKPQVMRIRATFEADAQGLLRAVEFAVVRSDPMAAFRRQVSEELIGVSSDGVGENGEGVGSRSFLVPPPPADGGLEEGKTHTYRLTVSADEPSPRLRAATLRLREVAESLREL